MKAQGGVLKAILPTSAIVTLWGGGGGGGEMFLKIEGEEKEKIGVVVLVLNKH